MRQSTTIVQIALQPLMYTIRFLLNVYNSKMHEDTSFILIVPLSTFLSFVLILIVYVPLFMCITTTQFAWYCLPMYIMYMFSYKLLECYDWYWGTMFLHLGLLMRMPAYGNTLLHWCHVILQDATSRSCNTVTSQADTLVARAGPPIPAQWVRSIWTTSQDNTITFSCFIGLA